jgi:hypothetical protein
MSLLNRFNNIFNKDFSFFEILLNLSFILIISVIIYIVYWNLLNRKIANLNRCKINLNSIDNYYNVYSHYNNKKIYSINYETGSNHNVDVKCSCPVGNIANTFKIPLYNHRTDQMQVIDKYCLCDDYYNFNSSDGKNSITYSGDDFLTKYYSDNFDNEIGTLKDPSKKLKFPLPL